jgi:hypothetical protein
VGYGHINELLEQRGQEIIPTTTVSRHREKCLGLQKKVIPRGEVAARPVVEKAPPPLLPLPSDQELIDESKRVLFWNLKNNPKKVPFATVAAIIVASMKEKKPDKPRTFDEILAQLGQDAANEAGASMAEESDSESAGSDS